MNLADVRNLKIFRRGEMFAPRLTYLPFRSILNPGDTVGRHSIIWDSAAGWAKKKNFSEKVN